MRSRFFPLALLGLCAGATFAADYPTRPITVVVPFAAGGPTDVVGRIVGASMSQFLKQTIVIDNSAGAGGTIGMSKVAKAAPDGYTLLISHIGHSTAPALYRKLPFKPVEDFEPIGLVTDVPMTFIAKRSLPPNNLKELIAYVKGNKDKLTIGNAGLGAASHLCGMLFMSTLGTDLTTVSYKGTAPAMNDLLGGQIDILCDQTTNTTQQIKADKVKAYAVTTATRVPSLPNVPTTAEAGMPGFQVAVWHAIYAPKGTPKPVIDRLTAALQHALKDPNVKARFGELGTEPVAIERGTPEALRNHLKAEIDKWGPIIKKAGVYAD
jgi:tripartite-type tricarboxylate transporter receptor subunit TctC